MLAEIMTANSFGEVMFLVAFILFVIEVVLIIKTPTGWVYSGLLVAAGFACAALGWLALTTGD
jgi:hypothetical protein